MQELSADSIVETDAAGDLFEYAAQGKLVANILEEEPKAKELAGLGYTATPFGVMQKVPRLAGFSLEGTKMRRLRYQIGHYEKHGRCETREYRAGSDPATDRTVAALVDAWKAGKKQIPIQSIREGDVVGEHLIGDRRITSEGVVIAGAWWHPKPAA